MRRVVLFPQVHPRQVEHTTQVDSFLERLRVGLDLQEHPDAAKHPNCAAVPGSKECGDAVTPMCDTCPWWLETTGGET
jgi:hypothetical protein